MHQDQNQPDVIQRPSSDGSSISTKQKFYGVLLLVSAASVAPFVVGIIDPSGWGGIFAATAGSFGIAASGVMLVDYLHKSGQLFGQRREASGTASVERQPDRQSGRAFIDIPVEERRVDVDVVQQIGNPSGLPTLLSPRAEEPDRNSGLGSGEGERRTYVNSVAGVADQGPHVVAVSGNPLTDSSTNVPGFIVEVSAVNPLDEEDRRMGNNRR